MSVWHNNNVLRQALNKWSLEISRSIFELKPFRALRVNICPITRLRLISRLHFLRHLRPCIEVDVTAVQWEP